MKYIHYGSNEFKKCLAVDAKNMAESQMFVASKPEFGTGFWGCNKSVLNSWKDFCINEDFYTKSLNKSFEFDLKEEANIYQIDGYADLFKLPGKSEMTIMGNEIYNIDFEECALYDIDALEVTNIEMLHNILYGWDCNCILVLNTNMIVT